MSCISTRNLNISYGNLDIVKDLNLDIMNVSGNKAKIVGDYTAIISLKDINNYAWIDNSVDDISIEWSIVWPENKIAIVEKKC